MMFDNVDEEDNFHDFFRIPNKQSTEFDLLNNSHCLNKEKHEET